MADIILGREPRSYSHRIEIVELAAEAETRSVVQQEEQPFFLF